MNREEQVIRQAKASIRKIESKSPGARAVSREIERHIRTSSKPPRNWREMKARAREQASGIRGAVKEKAKKSKLGAGFWFLVLIIVVPILVVVFLILNRKVELPQEGEFTDDDFKP